MRCSAPLRCEAFSTFAAAGLQYGASGTGFHAHAKSVTTLALQVTGLKSPFHRCIRISTAAGQLHAPLLFACSYRPENYI